MFVTACQVPHLAENGRAGVLRRPGIDIPLVRASLDLPLDAESETPKPLVDVADPALLLRQAQTHRCEHRRHRSPERFSVGAGPVDHDDDIIRISDKLLHAPTGPPILHAPPYRSTRTRLRGELHARHYQ